MSRENQSEWPRQRASDGTDRTSPVGFFQTSDGILKSDRSLAGPLRLGTEPRVGPKGALRSGTASDFGMDRVSPRGFDPIGTSDVRAPAQEASTLVSRETRRAKKRD
jgi:hypothetical protein